MCCGMWHVCVQTGCVHDCTCVSLSLHVCCMLCCPQCGQYWCSRGQTEQHAVFLLNELQIVLRRTCLSISELAFTNGCISDVTEKMAEARNVKLFSVECLMQILVINAEGGRYYKALIDVPYSLKIITLNIRHLLETCPNTF